MNALRIAYVVGGFPDLSETFVVQQVAGMAARGHAVDVYTTARATAPYWPGAIERYRLRERTYRIAPTDRLAGALKTLGLLFLVGWRAPGVLWRVGVVVRTHGWAGSLRLAYAALALVRRGAPRYDVIHAQFGPYGALAVQLVAVGAWRGPIITSFRGYDLGKHLRAHPGAYAELFRRGTLFLPVSATLAERLIAAGCEQRRIRVHHSGIACRRLRLRENRPRDGRVRIVTVARLVEKKGVADAIRAIARLHTGGKTLSYTVVGDGPLREALEQLVREVNLGSVVRFAGAKPHDETLKMINAAHILVAPSVTAADGDEEGIPNAVKEAMALGLPVVATRHGGIPELVAHGVSGWLVPERDPAALAERLAYVIDHPETWAGLGRAARARIEAEYDIDRLNDELVGLYREATARYLSTEEAAGEPTFATSREAARRS
ncbi:MAG: glycosyltransferase [Sulfurifustaceae bacterium]